MVEISQFIDAFVFFCVPANDDQSRRLDLRRTLAKAVNPRGGVADLVGGGDDATINAM